MYFIRTIQPSDNPQIAHIIRQVSEEFGLAADAGFAVGDSILDQLSTVYSSIGSHYWVITNSQGQIFGGGGVAPLKGAPHILEIQKMYFSPQIRGMGFAQKILELAFAFSKTQHIDTCYLETTANLFQAVKLYEKMGFVHLKHPLGHTGHSHACEIWMKKSVI